MNASKLPDLVGRYRECAVLDELLTAPRAGEPRVRVLRGEAGMGKSVLLEYAAARASHMTVTRAQGVEADMELPYASLHQLCAPFLARIDELPAPERDALRVAFGTAAGDAPDRFLVGLAVLTLLTRASEDRTVLVLRTAFDMFDGMRAAAFAERARRELTATGEHVRTRATTPSGALTPQESQIATLAAAGMTNARIGAELFISPHTVEWHLRKVYAKLGINSRRALPDALAGTPGADGRPRPEGRTASDRVHSPSRPAGTPGPW